MMIDDDGLRRLVADAQAAGETTVRIVLERKSKVGPSGTVRLGACRGPASSEDHPVVRIDASHVAAIFRVSDLAVHLRAKQRRCHALGCEGECQVDHLMCVKHWTMVPARFQVAAYQAKSRGSLADLKVRRRWIVAAERAICWVAVREGKITTHESERRIEAAEGYAGAETMRDPYALLDAVGHP